MSNGSGSSQAPLNSAYTRVWLQEGRARPDHRPVYKGFMKMAGLNQSFGDIQPIFVPSNKQLGKFDQAGFFRDEEERPSTSLMGHYAADVKSDMIRLAKEGCPFDVQLHIGKCDDPTLFDAFQKILIFEEVFLTSISSDDLGALEPGEQGKVDETGDISAARMYEFMPLSYAERSPSVVTNRLVDVVICGNQSCGDCDEENSGCEDIYAISAAAGGSPGTPADVVFSLDKGENWGAHDIDTLGAGEAPDGVACVGQYLVVVSNASDSMHIALLSQFKNSADPSFTEVETGFVVAGAPNAIFSVGSLAFIVGANGYIYKSENPTSGVEVIDAGVSTTSHLLAVHAISEEFAVAVGEDGVIVTISNDLATRLASSPVGIGVDILTVRVKSENEWFIGTDAGTFFRTLDSGVTWTNDSAKLSGTKTAVTSIRMSSASVMYVSGTVGGNGAIWVSVNGGYTFERQKQGTGIIPLGDVIDALAVCESDVDFVVGVGLANNGTDGFIVIGSD